ncbi:MAG: hypothetical protein KDA84_19760 [Planctomycetaceae bacterium]|nr:hypothetical protein [Planctomycetaceae bacterium]
MRVKLNKRTVMISAPLVVIIGFYLFTRWQVFAAVRMIEAHGGKIQSYPTLDGLPIWCSRSTTTIDMDFCKVPADSWDFLTHFPDTQMLWLMDTGLDDRSCQNISQMKDLQFVNLSYNNITDDSMTYLLNMNSLSSVGLSGTNVSNIGVKQLCKQGHISELYVDDTNVTDEAIVYACEYCDFVTLMFSNTDIGDVTLKTLADKEELGTLSCSNTNVTDDGIAYLFSRQWSLSEVDISHNKLTLKSLRHIGGLKCLSSIDLSGIQCRTSVMNVIGKSKSIPYFTGKNTVFDWSQIQVNDSIKIVDLDLGGAAIEDDDIQGIANIRRITELDVNHTHVSDASVEAFIGMKTLRYLTLTGTRISEAGVRQLRNARPDVSVVF